MNFFNFFKSDSDDDDLYNVPKEFHKEILSIYGDYPEMPYFSPDRDFRFWIDNYVELFNSIVPKQHMVRLPNGLLAGHIIMLWRVSLNNFTNLTTIPTYFEYKYGVDGEEVIRELINQDLIVLTSGVKSVDLNTRKELMILLEKYDINYLKSDKKTTLVSKIIENLSNDQISQEIQKRRYQLTDKGKFYLLEYKYIIKNHTG